MPQLGNTLPIYCVSDHMLTTLGTNTDAHLPALRAGQTGLRLYHDPAWHRDPACCGRIPARSASFYLKNDNGDHPPYTPLEQWLIYSIESALEGTDIRLQDPDTLLILASTKGNIDVLEGQAEEGIPAERAELSALAAAVGEAVQYWGHPLVVCHACISGLLALDVAKRYLRTGQYRHAVVAGGDLVTTFTLSGFQAFQALSLQPCRPFDAAREGINLGEGAGTLVLSVDVQSEVQLSGSASANDAHHISRPAPTGEGLYLAIQQALVDADCDPTQIDYLCVHGTATRYNDEMEAQALQRAGLNALPLSSFKGYWGHTLGAAGLLESIATVQALKHGEFYPSAGFESLGVSVPLAPVQQHQKTPLHTCLKTASGFGGCNAAVIFQHCNAIGS